MRARVKKALQQQHQAEKRRRAPGGLRSKRAVAQGALYVASGLCLGLVGAWTYARLRERRSA